MPAHKETNIEEIKGKIIDSLLVDSVFDCNISADRALLVRHSAITGSVKEKTIRFGLKNKDRIKNIPWLGDFSKKIYHSILWGDSQSKGFTVVTGAQMSHFGRLKLFCKKMPFLGTLTCWVFMLLKMPSKLNALFTEVDELKSGLKTVGADNLGSELSDLRDRHDVLDRKMSELLLEVDRLKVNK